MMAMYVELYHGRKLLGVHGDVQDAANRKLDWEELDEWGCNGPTFGPFEIVHMTYMGTIRMDDDFLTVVGEHGDLIFYDGIGYGDMTVFSDEQLRDGVEVTVYDPDSPKVDLAAWWCAETVIDQFGPLIRHLPVKSETPASQGNPYLKAARGKET